MNGAESIPAGQAAASVCLSHACLLVCRHPVGQRSHMTKLESVRGADGTRAGGTREHGEGEAVNSLARGVRELGSRVCFASSK